MSVRDLLEYSQFALLMIACGALLLMWRKHVVKQFFALAALLAFAALDQIVSIPLMFFRKYTGLSRAQDYTALFFSHWVFTAIQTVLMIAIIYSIFNLAMRPLPGLHRLGRIVFRWVSVVSVLFAAVSALGPRFADSGEALNMAFAIAIQRVQEGLSVLILCLLLFVCFATKPLGLTFRSRIFGVALGLGVSATVQLIQAAWLATTQARSVYSPMFVMSTLGTCAAFLVWGAYFAMPEPERKMILLPTTSPFFFWNRLSEALGDSPGHVAISGIKPSPVEMKIMAAMGKAARQRESVAQAEANSREEMSETVAAS
jgi:hypothetical protein